MRASRLASLLAAIILSLSGCGATLEPVRLEVPPSLTLPTIPAEALTCLSDDAYEALVVRDTLLRARIKTLEDIILTTHN